MDLPPLEVLAPPDYGPLPRDAATWGIDGLVVCVSLRGSDVAGVRWARTNERIRRLERVLPGAPVVGVIARESAAVNTSFLRGVRRVSCRHLFAGGRPSAAALREAMSDDGDLETVVASWLAAHTSLSTGSLRDAEELIAQTAGVMPTAAVPRRMKRAGGGGGKLRGMVPAGEGAQVGVTGSA